MEGTIAVVTPWAANFEPVGWQFCNGKILSIAANTALFALIGTTYGGDGTSTFALPNLCGRVVVGTGTGQGIGTYTLGEMSGTESNTITAPYMAAHTHAFSLTAQMPVNADSTGTPSPKTAFPAPSNGNSYCNTSSGQNYGAFKASGTVSVVGAGSPVGNIQPVLGINYLICVEGIFPSRP